MFRPVKYPNTRRQCENRKHNNPIIPTNNRPITIDINYPAPFFPLDVLIIICIMYLPMVSRVREITATTTNSCGSSCQRQRQPSPPPNPFLPLVIYVDALRCAQFPSCKCKVKPLQMLIDRRRRHRRPSATRPLQNTLHTSHREGGEIASYTIFHANYKLWETPPRNEHPHPLISIIYCTSFSYFFRPQRIQANSTVSGRYIILRAQRLPRRAL